MKLGLITFAMAVFFAGCRTASTSSVKTDVVAQSFSEHCKFATPSPDGEKFELWFAGIEGGVLRGGKIAHSMTIGSSAGEWPVADLSAIDASVVTSQGKRGLRGFFKDEAAVDFAKFSCFNVGGNASKTDIVCLAKALNAKGERQAFWATTSSQRFYKSDLTYYPSKCARL